jgi:hypothetical protein
LGFIEKFEKTLEKKVNGLFSKTFKSGLEAVEIAASIKHEMDSKASILSRDRILVPNSYQASLSPQDFERMNSLGEPLIEELKTLVLSHAKKQGFQLGELLEITLNPDSALVLGQVEISSESKKFEVAWIPTLRAGNSSHQITNPRTTVGRDQSADIQINDTGLSRKHFEILWDGNRAAIKDLGSTNGTKISGVRIDNQAISSGAVIEAGRTSFTFEVIARAK